MRCLTLLLLASGSVAVFAGTLHLSPNGFPDGNGSPEKPFLRLDTALKASRTLKATQPNEPVTLEFGGGRYELNETLRLTPSDSGLTLRSHVGENATLSGGRRLLGWQRDPDQPGMWTVTLPEVRDGKWYFHQLFLNDERMQRARTPNSGYFQTTRALGTGSPIELAFKPGDMKSEWAQLPDAHLVMLMKWTELHLPVQSVDPATHVAMLPGEPRPYWMDEPDARYWVENVPDALDVAGEWYLDRATGVLRLLAPAGINPNEALVVAPRLQELVRVEGDTSGGQAVLDVKILGLTLADTDYEMPAKGMISPQSAVPVRGGIRVTHATRGRLEDCTLRNLGGYALDLGRGAQHWQVRGNTIRSIAAGGVRIGEPGDREPSAFDACHSHQISDNEVVQLGRVFAPGCGVILFQSGTNRIAHNHIADLFYTGISIGWNWGYRETPCRANVIEFNVVEQVGQGKLSDMGGFYTLGPQSGTVIRNNIFRDVQSYRYGGWALYTDEGSSGIVVENNVAYRCKDAGFHQHYGRDNIIRNNLLAWNQNHSVMRTRVEEHRSFWFTKNVIVANSGTLLGSNWSGTTNQFWSDENVWFDTRWGTDAVKYQFAGQSWAEWQGRGFDTHSVIADPLLVDPQRPELGLKPDSPAFREGYRQIDVSTAGPRPKGRRE